MCRGPLTTLFSVLSLRLAAPQDQLSGAQPPFLDRRCIAVVQFSVATSTLSGLQLMFSTDEEPVSLGQKVANDHTLVEIVSTSSVQSESLNLSSPDTWCSETPELDVTSVFAWSSRTACKATDSLARLSDLTSRAVHVCPIRSTFDLKSPQESFIQKHLRNYTEALTCMHRNRDSAIQLRFSAMPCFPLSLHARPS